MQEDLLDDLAKPPRLPIDQWGFLIWEFTLFFVLMTYSFASEYWLSIRADLEHYEETIGMFLLFYIGAVPFFNKCIEQVRLRIAVGFWLLINYGLLSLALSRTLLETFDLVLLTGIALSYIIYAIKAPSFESQGKGVDRKRPLYLFYLGCLGTLFCWLSVIYESYVRISFYLTASILLSNFGWMIYLIYKNRDDFDLLLYIPRLLVALVLVSLFIYLSYQ